MSWSPQQDRTLFSATRWIRERNKQVYRLFGFAGTGKTELARELGNRNGATHFASFTGKASHVMRQRGCEPVSTIHSLIYRAYYDDDDERWYYDLRDKDELVNLSLIVVGNLSLREAARMAVLNRSGQRQQQESTPLPILQSAYARLVDAALQLAGADVILSYIRALDQVPPVSRQQFDQAVHAVRGQLPPRQTKTTRR